MDLDLSKLKETRTVGGYDLNNLLNSKTFFAEKDKSPRLSFRLHDIVMINDSEILKIKLSNGIVVRMMKFKNAESFPCATFDLVNEETKEIISKSDKVFVGGLGIADLFFKKHWITQWEVPIMIKLCRGFVLGDKEIFRILITDYNLKISKDADWYLRNELGLKI